MSRKIGALWMRESKDGRKYMSGILESLCGDIQIAVFKNDRKEKQNQPDYQIILSEKKEERKVENSDFFGDKNSSENDYSQQENYQEEEINISNIPF